MANMSKFHVVFSSSTLIRLDKDAFEGHLCQTVNNFVKQNKSSLLSPLRKRRPPQHIKHIKIWVTKETDITMFSECRYYDIMLRRWMSEWDELAWKEITICVIKGYAEGNDYVEIDTMRDI